jgi:putative colanic acid biosysnthesis UDP-glucose lipid carrier transferase
MLDHWLPRNQAHGVSAADASIVFIVKSLLFPVATVLTLLLCLLSWQESLSGTYFLIAVLAFFGAADVLDVAHIHDGVGTGYHGLRSFCGILLRWMVVIAFIWLLLRLAGLSTQLNATVLMSWAFVTPLVLWSGQLGARQYLIKRAGAGRISARRAIIIGMTDIGLRLAGKLREDLLLRTEVVGFFEDRGAARLPPHDGHRILGKSRDVPEFILAHPVDVVYITLPMTRDPRVLQLLDALRDSTVSIYFVPDPFAFNLIQGRFDLLKGIPVVAVTESPLYGLFGLGKRMSDVILSSLILVLLSPLLTAIACGVRMSSRGPVIFRQKRYGLDGKEIIVYKFRTMSVTEDGQTQYTQVKRNDARVTPFGAFLRRTSLDELPQFFNVLEGSMSIVGPRPHAIAVNEQYRRLIPSYMVRHKVKPGITGWAQVNGYRGGDDLESMQKRIEFDLEYLRHWSLQLDLLIMMKTATLVFLDRGAY